MILYLQMIDAPKDRSKFERLYLAYRDLMFYVANQILHNEQDAEDAVHQAFLKVGEDKSQTVIETRRWAWEPPFFFPQQPFCFSSR